MKPILVTRINEDSLEILTDYQTTIVKATANLEVLCISRGSQRSDSEDGLIGSIWTVEGISADTDMKLIVRHYKGESGTYEYIFKV